MEQFVKRHMPYRSLTIQKSTEINTNISTNVDSAKKIKCTLTTHCYHWKHQQINKQVSVVAISETIHSNSCN